MIRLSIAMLAAAQILFSPAASAAELPQQGPRPEARPAADAQADGNDKPGSERTATPDKTREDADPKVAAPEKGEAKQADASPAIAPPPADDAQCRRDLIALGTRFAAAEPIDDGGGCGIAAPLTVTEVLPGIRLEPPGTIGCHTARALARWTKDTLIPHVRIAGDRGEVSTIEQASAYVCKRRNDATAGKISEHARGNAIDIAAVTFSNGKRLDMTPRAEDGTLDGALQRAVTAAACLHFRTVLSPGSDATHETHLHLDMLERRGGFRYCR